MKILIDQALLDELKYLILDLYGSTFTDLSKKKEICYKIDKCLSVVNMIENSAVPVKHVVD